jgi:hypothetical protein
MIEKTKRWREKIEKERKRQEERGDNKRSGKRKK